MEGEKGKQYPAGAIYSRSPNGFLVVHDGSAYVNPLRSSNSRILFRTKVSGRVSCGSLETEPLMSRRLMKIF